MASGRVERRLSQVGERLVALRAELAMVDEQLAAVVDEAENDAIRALVSETPAAAFEANESRKHANAIRRHRDHVAAKIAELEQRQDQLLDRLAN
jgi:chromosome segregation ATPase